MTREMAMTEQVKYRWRGAITDVEMVELVEAHGGHPMPGWWDQVRRHSLGWVTARLTGGALVGFVNLCGMAAITLFSSIPRSDANISGEG